MAFINPLISTGLKLMKSERKDKYRFTGGKYMMLVILVYCRWLSFFELQAETVVFFTIILILLRITITTKGKYAAIEESAIPNLVKLLDDPESEVRLNALKVSVCKLLCKVVMCSISSLFNVYISIPMSPKMLSDFLCNHEFLY